MDQFLPQSEKGVVLIVDDEPTIIDILRKYLQDDGFAVVEAADGVSAIAIAIDAQPDIVLLDLGLPKLSGIDVFRAIRVASDIPVIIVTARDDEIDRIVGLEIGADDYICKPFSPREVVARVKAVLRRSKSHKHVASAKNDVLCFGPIQIDRSAREVRRRGILIDVTPTEFRLLNTLAENVNCALTRGQLLDHVSPDGDVYDRTLDKHIANLRHKIEDVPTRPKLIHTVVAIGYKLVDPARDPTST